LIPVLKGLYQEQPEHSKAIDSILVILEVAIVRIEEFQEKRLEWKHLPSTDFKTKLLQFFDATELVSRNRFHFIYPPEAKTNTGYLIDIEIELSDEDTVFAPPIIHDVIRDLAANARKYSAPGTRIGIKIVQDPANTLFLTIEDEGMGIPENEIDQVVQFCSRGSNVSGKPTMGNGFGLTKAYQVAKLFNGRFIIDSEPDKGTRIELSITPAA
jgi:signal transduction histidine kinase